MERAKKLQELEQANVLAEIEAMMGGGDEKSKKSKGKIKANSTSNKGSESQTPMFGRKQSSESASKNSKKASINEK